MTISERIAELRAYARQDGEECNEGSIRDFLAFPFYIAGMEGPYLFLLDNGDLRALWKSARSKFAVEFLGGGKARLVALPMGASERGMIIVFRIIEFPDNPSEEEFLTCVKEHEAEEMAVSG